MPAYIRAISTHTPEYSYEQDILREKMKDLVAENELQRRIIHQIYARSGIHTRHSILDDFKEQAVRKLYYNGHGATPGTGTRNKIYEQKGREMFVNVSKKVLEDHPEISPDSISHLITISCTGFYAPGPDYDIIKSLRLSPSIERYHLGFMGCYAVLPGLKLAAHICHSKPDAKVLVITNELCTLHFQGGSKTDDLISASVFADGSAGTIVSSDKPESKNYYRIEDFASKIIDEGYEEMAWTIGDTGFNMVLSTYIPEILSNNLDAFLDPVLNQYKLRHSDIDRWAVHPGGRAILDRVEQQLNLPSDTLRYSRRILSAYGNMSSATSLFVLDEILAEKEFENNPKNVLLLAFGPGITIESGLLVKHSA